MATSKNSLRAIYIDELKDIYNAEKQLMKALPKMAKAASSRELRNGFTQHLEQMKSHIGRLQQVFDTLGEGPSGAKCLGMEGLIEEGAGVFDEDFKDIVMDTALITAAQRVEEAKIAAYGTACTLAEQLAEPEHISLLNQILDEEKQTDAKLTELSIEINTAAVETICAACLRMMA